MVITRHEMNYYLKQLLAWIFAIVVLNIVFLLLFSSIAESVEDVSKAYTEFGSISSAFSIEAFDLNTAIGYYGFFNGIIISFGGAIIASIISINMIVKENYNQTAEFLLTNPISKHSIFLQKVFAIIIMLLMYNVAVFVSSWICMMVIGYPVVDEGFLIYHVFQFMMHFQIAMICILISSFIKRTNTSLGVAIAILAFTLNIVANVSPKCHFFRFITPFYYSDAALLINNKILLPYIIIGAAVTVVSFVIAYISYVKREINN